MSRCEHTLRSSPVPQRVQDIGGPSYFLIRCRLPQGHRFDHKYWNRWNGAIWWDDDNQVTHRTGNYMHDPLWDQPL